MGEHGEIKMLANDGVECETCMVAQKGLGGKWVFSGNPGCWQ